MQKFAHVPGERWDPDTGVGWKICEIGDSCNFALKSTRLCFSGNSRPPALNHPPVASSWGRRQRRRAAPFFGASVGSLRNHPNARTPTLAPAVTTITTWFAVAFVQRAKAVATRMSLARRKKNGGVILGGIRRRSLRPIGARGRGGCRLLASQARGIARERLRTVKERLTGTCPQRSAYSTVRKKESAACRRRH